MKVIVLGAGIAGTTAAWFLRQQGHDVTVIERRNGASQETTFGNASQISVSHSEPWSNPSAPLKIFKWLGKEDAPLLYRFRAEVLQWEWGARFLRECTPGRTAHNTRQCMVMADFSKRTLRELRDETGIEYTYARHGIMHFYTDKSDYESSKAGAKLMTSWGCPRNTITKDEVIRLEPALKPVYDRLVGGDFTPDDEHGDSREFTVALAKLAEGQGVQFMYNTQATRLLTEGTGADARIAAVEIIKDNGEFEILQSDAFVCAFGSFSTPFLKPLGVDLMIYPTKGYSATFPVIDPDKAPQVSLIDAGYKLCISRLGDRLRVAGTAEMNGYRRELNEERCQALIRRTSELFPDACDYSRPHFWTGFRPMTPTNIPYVGKAKQYQNLYLNTGHGTLGWTMGCGSGRAIAEIVSGKAPDIEFEFFGLEKDKK